MGFDWGEDILFPLLLLDLFCVTIENVKVRAGFDRLFLLLCRQSFARRLLPLELLQLLQPRLMEDAAEGLAEVIKVRLSWDLDLINHII